MNPRLRLPAVLLLTGIVFAAGTIVIRGRGDRPVPPGVSAPVGVETHGAALDSAIDAAQRRLAEVPGDWQTWASLGSAYVQQARVTGNPAFYPKADGALERSLKLETATNWQAMVGKAALANARHDFRAALDWGRRAEKVNPDAGSVYGVITDALTQLGDPDGARTAVQRMLDIEPGISAFTRASYDLEQRGDVARARFALRRALDEAASPADIAFCRYYLGELAYNNGDPEGALREYEAAVAADTGYQLGQAGRAKALAALGRTDEALTAYARATTALPLPELLAEYGDTLTAAGRADEAKRTYDLLAAANRLVTSNGGVDRLTSARFDADHGQPARALDDARAEWAARQNVVAADALAWALHRNGLDSEALEHSLTATRLGWRNAAFLYHRGAIRAALGQRDEARADLAEALEINPHFDILQAREAKRLLDALGGPA